MPLSQSLDCRRWGGAPIALLCSPLVLVLSACGSSSSAPAAVSSTATIGSITHIRIVPNKSGHPDSLYSPDPIRVHVGQTITWTNTDTDPHDVSADDGSFYSSPIAAGGSWRWTAKTPGTFTYTCTIHPDMHGTIIVSSA